MTTVKTVRNRDVGLRTVAPPGGYECGRETNTCGGSLGQRRHAVNNALPSLTSRRPVPIIRHPSTRDEGRPPTLQRRLTMTKRGACLALTVMSCALISCVAVT